MAFADLPPAEADKCADAEAAVRRMTEESLRREIQRREDEFLVDGGDYGIGDDGGDTWISRKELDEFAIASWVADLLDRQRVALTEAVLRAIPE